MLMHTERDYTLLLCKLNKLHSENSELRADRFFLFVVAMLFAVGFSIVIFWRP